MAVKYSIYVHDPDGDMGNGIVVGPFASLGRAELKADAIRSADERTDEMYPVGVECIILPIVPGRSPDAWIADAVIGDGVSDDAA